MNDDARYDAAVNEQVAVCQGTYCSTDHCDLGWGDCYKCQRVRSYPHLNVCGYCGYVFNPRHLTVCCINSREG